MPSAVTRTASVNSSRDCVRDTRVSSQGIVRPPTTMVKIASAATFASASTMASDGRERLRLPGERRHQHEHQHGDQVLDHQPSDGDVT